MAFLPSPVDIEAVIGTDPRTGEETSRKPVESDPVLRSGVQNRHRPVRGPSGIRPRLFRKDGKPVLTCTTAVLRKKERINGVSTRCMPISRIRWKVIGAGDICAAVGFKDIRTGDTLCDRTASDRARIDDFPRTGDRSGHRTEKRKKDLDKLGIALGKLSEEDPTFTVKTDEDSGQTVISGMGELPLGDHRGPFEA